MIIINSIIYAGLMAIIFLFYTDKNLKRHISIFVWYNKHYDFDNVSTPERRYFKFDKRASYCYIIIYYYYRHVWKCLLFTRVNYNEIWSINIAYITALGVDKCVKNTKLLNDYCLKLI